MPIVDLVYFNAGGGHRAAATALENVLAQQRPDWTVRLMNLQEVLDSIDVFRKLTTIRLEDIYNLILEKGWTLGSAQMLQFMHGVIRMLHPIQVKMLVRHWSETQPDMVVSLVPNFNRAMFDALKKARPAAPYVTILTDIADYPPHFWIEKQPQDFICGSDKAVEQAFALGHPKDRVHQTSGMILRPNFYEPLQIDRNAMRRDLGLKEDLPTGIVLFGGKGSPRMVNIAERLQKLEAPFQMIAICGKNAPLVLRLRSVAQRSKFPIHVEGFTPDIPKFMHLADFLIGKPGPGSISEAAAMGLPVIVERNSWTLPQERYNTEWVEEREVGIVLKSFSDVLSGVSRLAAELPRFQQNARAIQNRAIFEIPDILARILERSD
jgi:1,2-diacylglycerol 3-beta-galactosyltransferase